MGNWWLGGQGGKEVVEDIMDLLRKLSASNTKLDV